MQVFPHQVPQAAFHPIPYDGWTHRPADRDTHQCRVRILDAQMMNDHGRRGVAPTPAHGTLEVTGTSKARGGRQHGRRGKAQVASRLRPLRRRPAKMARPARVRIRRRKPCVLLRLRLFGWNVRLLTRDTPGFEAQNSSSTRQVDKSTMLSVDQVVPPTQAD